MKKQFVVKKMGFSSDSETFDYRLGSLVGSVMIKEPISGSRLGQLYDSYSPLMGLSEVSVSTVRASISVNNVKRPISSSSSASVSSNLTINLS